MAANDESAIRSPIARGSSPDERRTERLRLRRPTGEDAPALVAVHTDPRVYRHSPDGTPSPGKARRMAAEFIDTWERHGIGFWIVEHDGTAVGAAGVKPTRLAGRDCWNLYFRLVPEMWGRGLATEAAQEAIVVAGELQPDWPVLVATRPGNDNAVGLAGKLGLTRRPDLDHSGFLLFSS
jgi:ribosomal-protein-alanine N-acetyltransferase